MYATRELMLYEIEWSYNVTEATKKICANGLSAVNDCTVIRWFMKFRSVSKSLNQRETSSRLETAIWGRAPSHRLILPKRSAIEALLNFFKGYLYCSIISCPRWLSAWSSLLSTAPGTFFLVIGWSVCFHSMNCYLDSAS